jgi:AraC family transcriptional regulator of adaptative response / DNA-3-methyladenine glycosylase II
VRLQFDVPYAVGPALASLAAHAVPGLELVDAAAGTVERLLMTDDGPVPVRVRLAPDRVIVELDDLAAADGEAGTLVESRVRRWLGLDVDVVEAERHLRVDPVVGPLVAARPGLRVLGTVDGFETAVLTVLGQQVSVAAARTFGGRLVRAFGAPVDRRGLTVFPRASSLAAVPAEDLARAIGLTRARALTVAALARACAAGLALGPAGPAGTRDLEADMRTRRELLALPGIGPWTVEYLALRVLRDPDAFPAEDLVLRRSLGVARAAEAAVLAQGWAPYRGYGVAHLWAETAYGR